MNTELFIYDSFLKKFETKKKGNVGVEIEMPLLNENKQPVDEAVCHGFLEQMLQNGFSVSERDTENRPAFIENADGDVLSFDNSYNNFEFSMQYHENLCEIANRFYRLFETAQKYFTQHGHRLEGRGTNPYQHQITTSHVSYPVYNMVERFLTEYQTPECHAYPDFPAYLSSVQTHLDVDLETLPKAFTIFSMLDFARALLFSNSPDFDGQGYLCYRDFLWQRSAFSVTGNVGTPEAVYKKPQDIVCDFLERTMFHRAENGVYQIFDPVPVAEYFKEENQQDIDYYLSFKNIEITRRGTLEIRSDCTQPLGEDFAPPAFNLGILYHLDDAKKLTKDFFAENGITLSNSQLREIAVRGGEFPAERFRLSEYLLRLVDLAADGLKVRGYGEERFILPLYQRADTLQCPALKEKAKW